MARAAARSGPSTRMLEKGRIKFLFAEIFFFIGAKGDKKNPARQGRGIFNHETHEPPKTFPAAIERKERKVILTPARLKSEGSF